MPKAAELLIYDVIGRDFWGEGVDATGVINFLAEQDDDAEIHVRINSPGGSAFDGAAIYNVLAQNDRRVVVHIDGLAASAASLVAMAGDEIRMASNAIMMIHNASGITVGTAADHEKSIEMLRTVDESMAKAYAARGGLGLPDVKEIMDAETWMGAEEAEGYGFADIITEPKEASASWGRSGERIVASFRKSPQHLTQAPQMRPHQIAAQAAEEHQPMDMKKVSAMLGVPEDAHEDTLVAAIEARCEEVDKLTANLEAAMAREPDPRKYASRDDLEKIRARSEALEAKLRDRDLEDLLVRGEGRIVFSDNDRDRYRRFVQSGGMTLDALREEIENKPVSELATRDEVKARTPQTDANGLDQDDLDFCAQYKIDQELFAKNKAARLKVV